ncbi:MAG: tryptophan 7-halogenase [Rubrivivax sp.]|nr:tryptophan 7-halogenase [Rubrivivax sp.]
MSTGFDCDVFVAGGGPAGATVATLLARQGRRVVVVEKDRHPRFHIGESLLPANVKLFEELGVRAEVERIGMPKWGVEFVSPQHEHASLLEFAEAWDKSMPMAWQVRRSELDLILFRHAAASGAECHEGVRVRSAAFDAEGVSITALDADGAERRWRARYLVDASGRDTLLAHQFGIKRKHPQHNSAALFGHFRGARRLEGRLEGNISVFWFAHGWFWFIPLADGTTSVGAACWPYYLKQRDKPLKQYFLDTIALAPRLAERLAGAELVDDAVYATGNYSYISDRCAGPRYQMVGDAYAFIDPVFSSGVYLAMASAFVGADLAATTLDRGPAAAAAERRRFEAHMKKGPREFSWFIFRMTNPAIRELFMSPRNVLRAKEAVLAVLAGDIFGRTPFRGSLRFFKAVYYLSSLLTPRRTWGAWRSRSASIRDTGEVKGENVMAGAR